MINQEKNQKPHFPGNTSAVSAGLNMAVGMGVFSYAGYWLDTRTNNGGGWTLAGMFLGLGYCGYEVWKIIQNLNKDDQKNKKEANTGSGH